MQELRYNLISVAGDFKVTTSSELPRSLPSLFRVWLQSLLPVCYFPIIHIQREYLSLSSDSSLLPGLTPGIPRSQRNLLVTNPVLGPTLAPAYFYTLKQNSGFTRSWIFSRKFSPTITAHTNIFFLYLLQYLAFYNSYQSQILWHLAITVMCCPMIASIYTNLAFSDGL